METKDRNKMRCLIDRIKTADIAYFDDDHPIISDYEYDTLIYELNQLEKENDFRFSDSPNAHVSGNPISQLKKVTHTIPMLSCAKSKNLQEVAAFIDVEEVLLSWKEDGLTIVLRYDENGDFLQAITRGNGYEGEDITHNIGCFQNVPMHIPSHGEMIEIRGEGVISWKDFEAINAKYEGMYDHPRNLAAGTVRKLDPKEASKRPLYFKAFELVNATKLNSALIEKKSESLEFLHNLGFDTVEFIKFRFSQKRSTSTFHNEFSQATAVAGLNAMNSFSVDEAIELFDATKYPFPVDGIVAEYEDIAYGESLGSTGHHPNNRFAFKWNDDPVKTHLRGVLMNVTRNGMISLRAEFDPVEIEHSTVNKATLHNLDILESLELGIGDELEVIKANKIIPQVVGNLTKSGTYKVPMVCPHCGKPLVERKVVNTRMLFCDNLDCRKVSQLEHFCSKKAANIEGLSKSTLELLLNHKIIDNPVDLFTKFKEKRDEIIQLPRMGEKKYQNLLESIEKSRTMTLDRFLVCLDIPMIGATASEAIAKAANYSINEFANLIDSKYDFVWVNGIGKSANGNIYDWFEDFQNILFFQHLRKEVIFTKPKRSSFTNQNGSLAGKTVCITGTLANYTRAEGDQLIAKAGGVAASSVTKKTDYLVVASLNPGATKLNKAKAYGIPMLTEKDFLKMIGV